MATEVLDAVHGSCLLGKAVVGELEERLWLVAGHCDLSPVEAHLVEDDDLNLMHPGRGRSAHGHVDEGHALLFLRLFQQIEGGDEVLLIRVSKARHPRRCGARGR